MCHTLGLLQGNPYIQETAVDFKLIFVNGNPSTRPHRDTNSLESNKMEADSIAWSWSGEGHYNGQRITDNFRPFSVPISAKFYYVNSG